MKISIITVCRNSEATIRETILSVIGQDFPDIEYIVVDGNSTDTTMSIISEYKDKIKKVIHEPDKGIYDAMNKGIKACTGDIIGILNSDDVFNKMTTITEVHAKFTEAGSDSVYGDLVYVDFSNLKRVVRYWRSGSYNRSSFMRGWMPPHPAFFVKRHVYESFGTFNDSFRISADYELMLRFLFRHNISTSYLPSVITRMRVGGVSNHSLSNRLLARNEDLKAWEINKLKPAVFTILLKPMRKIVQFIPFLNRADN